MIENYKILKNGVIKQINFVNKKCLKAIKSLDGFVYSSCVSIFHSLKVKIFFGNILQRHRNFPCLP